MKRAVILALLLAGTMSAIFVMPEFRESESALDTSFDNEHRLLQPIALGPSVVFDREFGNWLLMERPPSEKELSILAKDTEFSIAICGLPRIEEQSLTGQAPIDSADLSIVLSGYDLANSIHRPERCLPAQGHKILKSEASELELSNGRTIPVTRLLTERTLTVGDEDNQRHETQSCIVYYFFVGRSTITASHMERTFIDIKDRVFRGEAQRWAYVSAFIPYVDRENPEWWKPLNRDQADKKIRQLLVELAEEKVDWAAIQP